MAGLINCSLYVKTFQDIVEQNGDHCCVRELLVVNSWQCASLENGYGYIKRELIFIFGSRTNFCRIKS